MFKIRTVLLNAAILGAFLLGCNAPASAAEPIDGSQLSLLWAVPFFGTLMSIAVWPLVSPGSWHRHFGKITAVWAAAFLLPFVLVYGTQVAAAGVIHAALAEYLPFILLLTALFTVSGGVYIQGNFHGTPLLNTVILATGTVLASWMGTTGASMLLIRPLIRANDNRKHQTHVVVFFIFLVSNVGGSLTPLGDPPLFLGFLQGVDFFWTASHILPETLFLVASLLGIFYCVDRWLYATEGTVTVDATADTLDWTIQGKRNLFLLAAITGLVLASGLWDSDVSFELLGTVVTLPAVLRDLGLVAVVVASLAITPAALHRDNHFSWEPMKEVAKLFAGIFLTIIPVLAMLKAGLDGPFAGLVAAVSTPEGQPNPAMYFWVTGILSAFLDNAPTYLVFFNIAGGDATALMTTHAPVLAAISAGAVFMGAITYIGNAPNLMVKAIAEDRGVVMPGFFGFMLWSTVVLAPLFGVVTLIWFR